MECSLSYFLLNEEHTEAERGEARAKINEEGFYITPVGGSPMSFSHREVVDISEGDYKIKISLSSGEILGLYDLGYSYEDFIRVLSKMRNQLVLKDMLVEETLKKSGIDAEFSRYNSSNVSTQSGNCELRFYETSFVVIPEKNVLFRIPATEVSEFHEEEYTIVVILEDGDRIVLSKIGSKFDYTKRGFSELMNELSLRTQSILKELAPSVNSSVLRKAAGLLKDGKAVRRSDLECISSELWKDLEKKLVVVGLKESYDFLASMAQKDRILMGVKRGLMGSLTGNYLWFFIPIYSTNPKELGNAIAMEAGNIPKEGTSEKESGTRQESETEESREISDDSKIESGGKATYFFRITSRKDYSHSKSIDELHNEAARVLKLINRSMLDINFRREPIYLPDERLDEPKYERYKFSIQKIPNLKTLRQLFIGRVIHASTEQWKQDVIDLLKFNLNAQDDSLKWVKQESQEQHYNQQNK